MAFDSGSLVLYALVAIFVAVVIFMLMGKKIDFKRLLALLDLRPKRMVVTSQAKLFWQPDYKYSNLTIPSKDLPEFDDTKYSLLFDCVLYNSRDYRHKENGPYRQILHRGSNELASKGALIVSGCSSSGELPPYGLPKRMNPGVFLDPNVNDILVFVDVDAGVDTYRESVRLTDIPLDIPFRIGIVVNNRVLEIYINCRLETTKLLSNEPKHVENEWYGLAGPASAQAQIQNLYVWTEPLPVEDILPLCPALPKFVSKRPLCEQDAGSAIKVSKDTNTTGTSIDLGFGKKLSQC